MARLNINTFRKALIKSGGNQTRIATQLELTRSAVCHFLKKHPEMRLELDNEAEQTIDVSEDIIDMAIMVDRDLDTAKWKVLNSKRGKDRGYGPKTELEHSGETQPHTFNLIVKSVEEIKREKLDNQPKAA